MVVLVVVLVVVAGTTGRFFSEEPLPFFRHLGNKSLCF